MYQNIYKSGFICDFNNMEEEIEKRELLKDTLAKTDLGENELINIRKERIIKFLKRDVYLNIFLLIAIISLFVGMFGLTLFGLNIPGLGIVGFFSSLLKLEFIKALHLPTWLVILSCVSAGLAYHKKRNLSFIPIVVWIMIMAVYIRTRNLDKLRDITTGAWTLGPDLDPFLFSRWSEYIVEHGKLFAIDTMRYSPLGFNTQGELLLHPYMMAWFHKIAVYFGSESVMHSAVIYPVFMFALTVLAFFFFTRIIFVDSLGEVKANLIALIASFFLSVLPVFLPRSIAGIPEKESAAFLFMFLAFYFFISAWKNKNLKIQIILAVFAGLSTGAMALIWGGYQFVLLTFSTSIFILFMLGGINKNKFYTYITWIITYSALMWFSSIRYHFSSLIAKGTVVVAFIILTHFVIFNTKVKKYFESERFRKFPPRVISLVCAMIVLVIIASIAFGPYFIINHLKGLAKVLIEPVNTRFIQTVAENRSPFFVEWVGSFGPSIKNIPIFFWLFFVGSFFLFYQIMRILPKKERFYLTASYVILLFSITFSKYSSDSNLNGTNNISVAFYALGFLIFLYCAGTYYYRYYKKEELNRLENIDIGLISLLALFMLTLVSLRGGIRLVIILTPSVSIIAAYFIIMGVSYARKAKGGTKKMAVWAFAIIIVWAALFSGLEFYKSVSSEASFYAPSSYTQQWQKAMAWVRDNTPESSVFGHWWDYGYWLQSIGKRATVLDGGNAQGNWNRMMGRYALTGDNEREALEFLYAHKTTHFLIDSTDIGKYSAFSSIGSDINQDRFSWLPVFARDKNQVQETKNGTIYIYAGGTSLDEDIKYEDNGSKIFLPSGKAGLGAILIEQSNEESFKNQPIGIFVYQDQQFRVPLRYGFVNGKFYDFGSGIEAGVFLMPNIKQNTDGYEIEENGALIYLSKRTVKSQLARLYLYQDKNSAFKLIHSEDDLFVALLKTQRPEIEDIVFFNGIRGPIRIFEIEYPNDIELKEEYLETAYPEELAKLI